MDIKNTNLIDIREPYEYKTDHILKAINVPYDLLELAPERYLLKNKIYCLYCNKGIKSLGISKVLISKGYNTYSLDGGYDKYKNENN